MQTTKMVRHLCISFILFVLFDGLAFGADTDSLVVTETGNVGIGTTNPDRILSLESSGPNSIYLKANTGGSSRHHAAVVTLESNNDYRGRGMFLPHSNKDDYDDPNAWFVGVPYKGRGFQIGNSDVHTENTQDGPYIKEKAKLFIAENGNVGIGTTDPGAELDVQGRIIGGFGARTTSGVLDWNDTSNIRSGSGYTLLKGDSANGPGPANYFHPFNFEYGKKDGTGNITQLAIPYGRSGSMNKGIYMRGRYKGSWSPWRKFLTEASSDARLKKDIVGIDNALQRVSQLRGVNYQWADRSWGEGSQIGVIAQEVEEVFPEVVSTDNQGYRSVSYRKLVAPLIEAVKELKAENENLKLRLEQLSIRLAALEEKQDTD
jgi:hypothetical protein